MMGFYIIYRCADICSIKYQFNRKFCIPSLVSLTTLTAVSCFNTYFDNDVYNWHQIRHGRSLCPYLALRPSRNNKHNASCPFLTFFVKTILVIFPPIFAQHPLTFLWQVHYKCNNGGEIFSSWKDLFTEIKKSPARWIGL